MTPEQLRLTKRPPGWESIKLAPHEWPEVEACGRCGMELGHGDLGLYHAESGSWACSYGCSWRLHDWLSEDGEPDVQQGSIWT